MRRIFRPFSHALEYERSPLRHEMVVERVAPAPWPVTEFVAVLVLLLASIGLGCVSWWIALHP
jgi:hypothetical protein